MADVDDSSSSSSDDEDFLTLQEGGGAPVDREALVRKKLLENFYGKTAVAAAAQSSDSEDETEDEDDHTRGEIDDLDSNSFDAKAHAEELIQKASVHELLETEERMALQVRTLDSTMQTLVYENYSRFIDATDAIKSIGINVQANEQGLNKLSSGMQVIDESARAIDDALGSIREKVAEKIRVKRLLSRLDSLLKLPATLKSQIRAGKYRTASRSHLSAASILSKHSQGFESLRSIEDECHDIMEKLKLDLRKKIIHWSGSVTSWSGDIEDDDESDNIPKPPKSMSEIYECAGALHLLHDKSSDMDDDELQSKSISASLRFLDRLLDAHLIEVQDRRFNAPSGEEDTAALTAAEVSKFQRQSYLVPQDFLDSVLEGATLYGITFGTDEINNSYVKEMVGEAFASFLIHMQSLLLEESTALNRTSDETGNDGDEPGTETGYKGLSSGLASLVTAVRELASGLALPEVGIKPDYASRLVDQVSTLTESMMRRRVEQKFRDLRVSVVRNCLMPFASRFLDDKSRQGLAGIANSALSDCLQLVDDSIRSVLANGEDDASPPDLPLLKEAVQSSTRKFAWWFANVCEILAGGDINSKGNIAEARHTNGGADDKDVLEGAQIKLNFQIEDDISESEGRDDGIMDLIDSILNHVREASIEEVPGTIDSAFVLAVLELARFAESSIAENLEQSIMTHLGSGKKKSRGLFPSESQSRSKGEPNAITRRFQLAVSRIVVLHATSLGAKGALALCDGLTELHGDSAEIPVGPRDEIIQSLVIVKQTCLLCAEIFGEKPRAGPVPVMQDTGINMLSTLTLGKKSGLMLDVERMFKERIVIYPHPFETMETSRSSLVFLVLRVAFRALFESVRMIRLSSLGYRQILVDIEFLKLMIPHYINSDFQQNGVNACMALTELLTDISEAAGEQCETDESIEQESHSARSTVRSFMSDLDSDTSALFTIDEDGEISGSVESG